MSAGQKIEHNTFALEAAEAALMVREAVNVTRPPTTIWSRWNAPPPNAGVKRRRSRPPWTNG